MLEIVKYHIEKKITHLSNICKFLNKFAHFIVINAIER